MSDSPILFSDPMVRAILDGRKTQTRRVVKPQPDIVERFNGEMRLRFRAGKYGWHTDDDKPPVGMLAHSPYGQPGDRLWVREAFGYSRQDDDINDRERVVCYRAGHPFHVTDAGANALKRTKSGALIQPNHFVQEPSRWHPSIHMPRWASRITLEITGVRVERLQEISEADAKAEGLTQHEHGWEIALVTAPKTGERICCTVDDPRVAYRALWESINGPGSWNANPWVWAIDFRRVQP